jgi:3-methyladenine DNA glycosylase AlkD
MNASEIIAELQSLGNEANREGMARFGIKTERALGVSIGALRQMARRIGTKNHALAMALWDTGLHEARLLATIVDDPEAVTEEQMECWVSAFDSWDLCDQCCGNLFDETPYAWDKAVEWPGREREYEKRAGFVLMACLAVHDKNASDERYLPYLDIIKREALDRRNFVKKAVNWALRQIGKRSIWLNQAARGTAQEILAQGGKNTWVASDALQELTSEKVQTGNGPGKKFGVEGEER